MPESAFIPARKFYDIFLKSFDNVIELFHWGSCKRVDHETALQKARKMKRKALAKARRAKVKDLGINTVWDKVI